MGEVIKLRRPRNRTIRGHARECLTGAMDAASPDAIIIIVLSKDGSYALRSALNPTIHIFDAYARAECIISKEKGSFLDTDSNEPYTEG